MIGFQSAPCDTLGAQGQSFIGPVHRLGVEFAGVGQAFAQSDDAAEGIDHAKSLARRARDGARAILALNVVPPTLATLAVAFDLVSPAVAPCAALLGTLAAAFRARED